MILHSLQSWTLLQLHIIVQLQSVLLQEQPTSKWYVSRNLTTISKDAVKLVVFCPSLCGNQHSPAQVTHPPSDEWPPGRKTIIIIIKREKKTEKIFLLRFYSSLVRWMHAGRGRSWNQLTPHLLHSGPLFFLDILGPKMRIYDFSFGRNIWRKGAIGAEISWAYTHSWRSGLHLIKSSV